MPKPRTKIDASMKEADVARIDKWAETQDISRAEAIRQLTGFALDTLERRPNVSLPITPAGLPYVPPGGRAS